MFDRAIRGVGVAVLGLALVTAPATARADDGRPQVEQKDHSLRALGTLQKVGGKMAERTAGALETTGLLTTAFGVYASGASLIWAVVGGVVIGVPSLVAATPYLVGSIVVGAAGYAAIHAADKLDGVAKRWVSAGQEKISRSGSNVSRSADTRGAVSSHSRAASGSSGGAAAAGMAR